MDTRLLLLIPVLVFWLHVPFWQWLHNLNMKGFHYGLVWMVWFVNFFFLLFGPMTKMCHTHTHIYIRTDYVNNNWHFPIRKFLPVKYLFITYITTILITWLSFILFILYMLSFEYFLVDRQLASDSRPHFVLFF